VCDGATWARNEIELKPDARGYVSCWIHGLPENADRANVSVYFGEQRLPVDFVGQADAEGFCQVNAIVPANTEKVERPFRVECAQMNTEPVPLRIM
jgi:uncharacterized protein (TIGR03437 family)